MNNMIPILYFLHFWQTNGKLDKFYSDFRKTCERLQKDYNNALDTIVDKFIYLIDHNTFH